MSFRELRALSETMRVLGYPRVVSLEGFRRPNFPLVAELLYWLVTRLSPPHATIPDDIETEAARLAFLAAALAAALEHGGLALSARALYAADGRAARELLRLARVLLQAVQAAEQQQQLGGATAGPTAAPALLRPSDTALVRSHADALAGAGTKLAALLAEEPQLAEARAAAGRLLDVLAAGPGGDAAASAYHKVERSLGDAAAQTADEAGKMKARTTELGAALDGLREQLARRQAELGRARTRLEAVATLRPAHADELSRLHGDMAEEHAAYVTKCRNLDYLAAELAALRQAEREAAQESARAIRQLQRRLREEETRAFRGDEDVGDDELAAAAAAAAGGAPGAAAAAAPPAAADVAPTTRERGYAGSGAAALFGPGSLVGRRGDGDGGQLSDDDEDDDEGADGEDGDGAADGDGSDFDDTDF